MLMRHRMSRPEPGLRLLLVLLAGLVGLVGHGGAGPAAAIGIGPSPTFDGAKAATLDLPGEKAVGGTLQLMVGHAGTVYYNEGGGWLNLEYPTNENLHTVDATSFENIWVGGTNGLQRYNGSAWVEAHNAGQPINGVMVRPGGVVACGGNGLVIRNTGSGWVNLGSGTTQPLNAIWGVSVNDFWVCGTNGIIRRFRNGQWTTVPSNTAQALNAIWGAPGVGPFFGGNSGTFLEYRDDAVLPITTGNSNHFFSVHGTSATNVWAAGQGGWVWFWDGDTLTTPTPGGSTEYRAVLALPSGLVTIGGANGVVQHRDGGVWSSNNLPVAQLIRGAVVLPSTGNAGWWDGFAADPRGVGLSINDNPGTVSSLIVHGGRLVAHGSFNRAGDVEVQNIAAFDGTEWTALPGVGQAPQLYCRSLDVFEGDLVVAHNAGGEVIVQRLQGDAWVTLGALPQNGNPILHLRTLTAGGQTRLYAAGLFAHPDFPDQGGVFRWDPDTEQWLSVGSGLPEGFIYGMNAFNGDLYAAVSFIDGADSGLIMRLTGGNPSGTWTTVFASDTILPLALVVHDGQLYAGCYGTNIDALRRFVPGGPADWQAEGAVLLGATYIFNLLDLGDRILMMGQFQSINGILSPRVAYWQDGVVHGLGTGLTSGDAVAAARYEGDAFVGASGLRRAGGRESFGIARWREPSGAGTVVPTATVSLPATLTPNQPVLVTANVQSFQTVRSVTLSYRAWDSDDFTHRTMNPVDTKANGSFRVTIPGADVSPLGLQHFVTVQTDLATVTVPPNAGVASGFTGAGVTFLVEQEVAQRYELFGIPFAANGNNAQVFEGNLGSYDPSKWRLERWNPATESYLPFPQVPQAVPGRGYYLIQRTPRTMTIAGATTSTVGGASIQLEPGWNMIATPYLFEIPWNQVPLPAGVQNRLVGRFNDAYQDRTTLEPWRGYFVFHGGASAVTLTIPPISVAKANADMPELPLDPAELPGCDWLVRITASQGERTDLIKTVGALTIGQDGPGDLNQPPFLPHDLALWIEREDQGRVQALRRDLRDFGAGQVWDLVLRPGEGGEPVTLAFDGVDVVPAGLQVALATPGGVVDLRRHGGRWQAAVSGETRLRLVVGDPDLVQQAATTLPQPYALLPAYPNPFNPATTLAFTMPRDGRVRIELFDVAGRRVRTLVDGVYASGRHEVVFDGLDEQGRSLSSGLYFARLEAGDFGQTRKLTLVR